MADDIVTELKAHRDIDDNRCCECGHWTDHDADCMVGRAADEIERLRSALDAEGNDANLLMLEIERLRAAGDALYELVSVRLVIPADQHDDAVEQIRKWKEARRG